ncbi:MAG: MGMT family protein [Alphaproteobacteria bacterium]|nr:MGMT family protein [Alphaproteobacteria bacterium]
MNEQPKQFSLKTQNIFEEVYHIARRIPFGRVCSYGAIAKSIGVTKSARIVGLAMSYSHYAVPPVPAHRVVNSQGILTGKFHFNPPSLMKKLLQHEGLKVKNNQVVDFKTKFWQPLN